MTPTKSPHAVILLIDNNPISRSGLAAILDMAGHRCHCACDADATLRALDGLDLDLIICNVDFDGSSSPALYQKLASAGQKQGIPLIFRASAAAHPTLERALASGDALFLPSPFSHDELLRTAQRALWMPHLIRQHTDVRVADARVADARVPQALASDSSVVSPAAGDRLDGHATPPAMTRRPHRTGTPRHRDSAPSGVPR